MAKQVMQHFLTTQLQAFTTHLIRKSEYEHKNFLTVGFVLVKDIAVNRLDFPERQLTCLLSQCPLTPSSGINHQQLSPGKQTSFEIDLQNP